MVAKGVERATAPTRTCREREVQTEMTEEEEDPEEVGRIFDCSQAWLAGGIAAWSSVYMAV